MGMAATRRPGPHQPRWLGQAIARFHPAHQRLSKLAMYGMSGVAQTALGCRSTESMDGGSW